MIGIVLLPSLLLLELAALKLSECRLVDGNGLWVVVMCFLKPTKT